ncbi:MAG: DUF6502 family protein [Candidatus Eremiobacteraeota bacterium]|nr:DUF6502 family protein [Candidatus Eremiobacteraeota bacterium]
MSGKFKSAVLKTGLRILDPLVRLMLEAGVGLAEFHQLARKAYVRAAAETSPKGAPNYSKISMLTGVARATAAAILRNTEEEAPPERGVQRAERILRGWWEDPNFCDDEGKPAILNLRGRRSFEALVNRYSGDPRIATHLEELLRVKAVKRLPDQRLQVLSRTVATARWDSEGVLMVGERVRDVLETLTHNLKHEDSPRFTRFVFNAQIDPRYVPLLIRDMSAQASVLADAFEDALSNPKAQVHPQAAKQARRLGMAFYLIDEPAHPSPALTVPAKPLQRRQKTG